MRNSHALELASSFAHRAPKTQPAAGKPPADIKPDAPAPNFLTLFAQHSNSAEPPAQPAPVPPPAAPPPAPTAESVFGPNPWLANPTGAGPNKLVYGYNPYYFATPETAAKVAQMVGGTVVETNFFTPNGGPFAQQQPNQMVQLRDGRMINPGLVASFYTHGYPDWFVQQMVANEVSNT